MSNTVKHKFTSGKADGPDTTRTRPSNWNDEHAFAGGTDGYLLARDSSQTDGALWVKPGSGNLLFNSSFEIGFNNWSLSGAGATATRTAAAEVHGVFYATITRNGADARLTQQVPDASDISVGTPGGALVRGKSIVAGAWVRCSVPGRARIRINDGQSVTNSDFHPGDGTWRFLSKAHTVASNAGGLSISGEVAIGDTSADFDAFVLVLGTSVSDWQPSTERTGLFLPQSYVWNGDFRVWGAGASAAPTGWTRTGDGASVARVTSAQAGPYAAQLTRAGADARLAATSLLVADGLFGTPRRVADGPVQFLTVGAWVTASLAGCVRIGMILDGVTKVSEFVQPGAPFWVTLSFRGGTGGATPTVFFEVVGLDATATVAGFTFVEGLYLPDYVPSAFTPRKVIIPFGSSASQAQNLTRYYGPWGGTPSTNEVETSMPLPFKGVARNLRVTLDQAPAAGQNVAATIRKNETTDTALAATVTDAGRSASDVADEVEFAAGDLVSLKGVTSATSGTRFLHAAIEYEEIPV